MIARRMMYTLLAVSLGFAPGAAVAEDAAWSLKISDFHGGDGVVETCTLGPDGLAITWCSDSRQPEHEVLRRPLTSPEQEIVVAAIRRFSQARLEPRYENPNINDGCVITVDFAVPGERPRTVVVENVLVPELEALVRSLAPLLPPAAWLNHYPPDYVKEAPRK